MYEGSSVAKRPMSYPYIHKPMILESGMQVLKSMSNKVAYLMTRRQLRIHAVNQFYTCIKVCTST